MSLPLGFRTLIHEVTSTVKVTLRTKIPFPNYAYVEFFLYKYQDMM